MKEYRVEQEVYYLHKHTGKLVSRTELKYLLENQLILSFHALDLIESTITPTFKSKLWSYAIHNIPFNDDWETIVMQPHTLTKRDIYAILDGLDSSIIQGALQTNAKIKLVKELEKIDDRRFRFNVEIPTY